ncbi:MAG: hypothetical protein GEU75_14590 [Dehalococcoidia bacterium]|nr:hypothetical protein [Dehalococcoidia bacterium]
MENSYWSRYLQGRQLSRRRLLKGAAGVAVGGAALSLIGCGGGDDGGVKGDASGLLSQAVETTKDAKVGGAWASSYAEDIVNMDPILNNASPTFPNLIPVYSQLLKSGLSATKRPGSADIVGDLAQSWEFSGDGATMTLKLRPNMKWDPRPPTNGRVVTSADVKAAWDKYASVGNSRGELVRAANPDAPIDSVETPDANTVVFKMGFPYPNVIDGLSNEQTFYVMPIDDSFNFRSDMRGTGPYRLESFRPSASTTFVRNPDWYDAPRPYFERLERTLISDYATGLSQFKAGNIFDYSIMRPEDVLPTKREDPNLVLLPEKDIEFNAAFLNFSKADDSFFKDVRVRRALSMMLDRDLLTETFYNVSIFQEAGLPVKLYWHSHLAAGLPEWLDPQGTDLGEGAQYFQYNPAEAKKLVEAAGLTTPYAAPHHFFIDNAQEEVRYNEVINAMFNDGGVFNLAIDGMQYDTSWRNARASAGMGFKGVLWHRAAALSADVILTQRYTPKGRNSVSANPIPGITDLVLKQKTELDPKRREALIHDIQKAAALEFPDMTRAGTAPSFTLHQPWLSNHNVFSVGNDSAKPFVYAWYDESKRNS